MKSIIFDWECTGVRLKAKLKPGLAEPQMPCCNEARHNVTGINGIPP
jgi:hypothetical protein